MSYIPSHLYYILFELIKNSMRATAEHHKALRNEDDLEDLPPVIIIIGSSGRSEDVSIKVSDQGGGIPRSYIKRAFNYLFTTAPPAFQQEMVTGEDMQSSGRFSPLAGLGYGLPVARQYARYFGGGLKIMSVEGYGTDAYIYLNRFGNASSIWHTYGPKSEKSKHLPYTQE
jgi:pyruvate dehydrogenase kinase 2/3/4